MKHKTAELTGALLDAAVAKADGGGFDPYRPAHEMQLLLADGRRVLAGAQPEQTRQYQWSPSTCWAHGGPIIQRENIDLEAYPPDEWGARNRRETDVNQYGPTPLIAAMRAFVSAKLGDEVELP